MKLPLPQFIQTVPVWIRFRLRSQDDFQLSLVLLNSHFQGGIRAVISHFAANSSTQGRWRVRGQCAENSNEMTAVDRLELHGGAHCHLPDLCQSWVRCFNTTSQLFLTSCV